MKRLYASLLLFTYLYHCVATVKNELTLLTAVNNLVKGQLNEYCRSQIGASEGGCDVTPSPPVLVEGRIGKAGPRGPQGPIGPPGLVDYTTVERMINKEIGQLKGEFSAMLKSMETVVSTLKKGLCQVKYQGKCFTAINSGMNYYQGHSFCQMFGGFAANIYDNVHYGLLQKYVRSIMTPGNYAEPFLGMTYNPSNGELRFFNGTLATHEYIWYPGYPRSDSDRPAMSMTVRSDPADSRHGLFNFMPGTPRHGVICEFEM